MCVVCGGFFYLCYQISPTDLSCDALKGVLRLGTTSLHRKLQYRLDQCSRKMLFSNAMELKLISYTVSATGRRYVSHRAQSNSTLYPKKFGFSNHMCTRNVSNYIFDCMHTYLKIILSTKTEKYHYFSCSVRI